MKKLISLAVVFVLLLSLCACVSEPTLVGTAPANNSESTAPTSPSEKTFKLGEVVELDGVTVSLISVDKSKGSQFNKPADENEFVLCEFEISNNSTEELSVSSMLSFEAYCDDYACEYSISALMEKGSKDQLDGSVAPGKKMKGVIGYEVSKDWNTIEIQYTPDIWTGSKIVFIATNE